MNKLVFISSFLVTAIIFSSCSGITGSTEEPVYEFSEESFFVDGKEIKTFRSLNVISVGLKPDTDADAFHDYINDMGLQLISAFTHQHYSRIPDSQLSSLSPVILLLPPGADNAQFYSFSDNLREDSFANNPFIRYSLPAYSSDPEKEAWYYPNNLISVKPSAEDFSVSELSAQFSLEFLSKNSQIDLYLFRDNAFRHGTPYTLAKNIYESGNFRYVVPDGFWQIVRH
ncbi:MAG: hypothetical protein LAT75_10210 [Candidatus Cyclonatronum sp.]|uniref:hypothetical protein n=1 Tax=Cyclonatronum sp. TaxID=3024185 RepID=UPI0025C06374|nr:hypothetical protein [Cyclonatronum sp.]MCH8487233.1 hypothetical protein [Cyclonatronum sp.]